MDFIGGEDREQTLLLPDSLEDYVNEDNHVRVIDAFVNGLDMHGLGFLGAEPNGTGRPAYDPRDMLKLYAYGYMNWIRRSLLQREMVGSSCRKTTSSSETSPT